MPGTEPNLLEDHLGCASSLSHFLINDSLRRSLAYHRLPRPLFELSVLKLDGSSFEIQVAKMALVAEVKEAVEDFFKEFATEGELEISCFNLSGICQFTITHRSGSNLEEVLMSSSQCKSFVVILLLPWLSIVLSAIVTHACLRAEIVESCPCGNTWFPLGLRIGGLAPLATSGRQLNPPP